MHHVRDAVHPRTGCTRGIPREFLKTRRMRAKRVGRARHEIRYAKVAVATFYKPERRALAAR